MRAGPGDEEQGTEAGMYETSEDKTQVVAQQGGSGNPTPIPRQNLTSKGTGVRKRVASDTSSSNGSSRAGDSIRDIHNKIDDKTIRAKRRRQSKRRETHWSDTGTTLCSRCTSNKGRGKGHYRQGTKQGRQQEQGRVIRETVTRTLTTQEPDRTRSETKAWTLSIQGGTSGQGSGEPRT